MPLPDSIVGRILGHYRVLEQIGAGGMGVVYRARDERLERDVALKVLAPDSLSGDTARKRFRDEALALSRLNHPNIATVHDFDRQDGIDFLVTELVSGVSLHDKLTVGPLPEKEVLRISLQLAEGLEAAHSSGVIHRDLKPGNLKLTEEGRLKILDFGLAKRIDPVDQATITQSVVESGPMGTLAYMAPEQLLNEKVDTRADIWAVGVVMYELATGRSPFDQKSAAALTADILHSSPASPKVLQRGLSSRLADIILKCIEKDPDDRYQSVKELKVDLKRLAQPSTSSGKVDLPEPHIKRSAIIYGIAAMLLVVAVATALIRLVYRNQAPIRSIAVMPFENATQDPSIEVISDGMTEETINHLTQMPGLKVIARPTVFSYKSRHFTPQEIGKELGVRAIVLGRLVQHGDRLTVQVDVVDTQDGSEIWGGQFQRGVEEVQFVQNEIALQITEKLRFELSGEQEKRLVKRLTQSPDAYKLYLQGRFCLSELDFGRNLDCVVLFQRAIQFDSSFAQAWAGLADAYAYLGLSDMQLPSQAMSKAREAALNALKLDGSVSEAHTSMAIIKLCYDWDADGANAELRRALELNPGDIFGLHWHAHYLEMIGQFDKAHEEMLKVVELDPVSKMYQTDLAIEFYYMRQPEKVVQLAKSWTNLQAFGPEARTTLAQAYALLGRPNEALDVIHQLVATDSSNYTLSFGGMILASLGKRAEAETLKAQLMERAKTTYVPASSLAEIHFGLGANDEGFRYLAQACDERNVELLFVFPWDPRLDSIRSDSRFVQILSRFNLPLKSTLSSH